MLLMNHTHFIHKYQVPGTVQSTGQESHEPPCFVACIMMVLVPRHAYPRRLTKITPSLFLWVYYNQKSPKRAHSMHYWYRYVFTCRKGVWCCPRRRPCQTLPPSGTVQTRRTGSIWSSQPGPRQPQTSPGMVEWWQEGEDGGRARNVGGNGGSSFMYNITVMNSVSGGRTVGMSSAHRWGVHACMVEWLHEWSQQSNVKTAVNWSWPPPVDSICCQHFGSYLNILLREEARSQKIFFQRCPLLGGGLLLKLVSAYIILHHIIMTVLNQYYCKNCAYIAAQSVIRILQQHSSTMQGVALHERGNILLVVLSACSHYSTRPTDQT